MNDTDVIKTTVNLTYDNYELLVEIADRNDLDLQYVMLCYLKQIIKYLLKNNSCRDRAMEYQDHADMWKKQHISFSKDEFDIILDIKKAFRFCTSLMLAMAVNMFDESILFAGKEDSYPDFEYNKNINISKNIFEFTSLLNFADITPNSTPPPD